MLVLRRPANAVVWLVISGTDIGEHGTGPFEELANFAELTDLMRNDTASAEFEPYGADERRGARCRKRPCERPARQAGGDARRQRDCTALCLGAPSAAGFATTSARRFATGAWSA